MGAKKFGMSLEAQGTVGPDKRPLGGISRDFGQDIPGVPEKFVRKNVRIQFLAPNTTYQWKTMENAKQFRSRKGFHQRGLAP